jgi:glutathione S-transferase
MLAMFDLAGRDSERRFSPYCWRIKMALAHKGLAVETIAWRFTDKSAIAASGQEKVPVLVDRERWISDSWAIAEYLEDNYPDRPSLFGGPVGRALARYFSCSADALNAAIAPFVMLDIYHQLDPKDQAYFRTTREKRFGMTLERLVADRDARVESFRKNLAPLRTTLSAQPYFGGERALYVDYALFGAFQWARCVSDYRLLAADDPIRAWRDRLLDAFDGLARSVPAYD